MKERVKLQANKKDSKGGMKAKVQRLKSGVLKTYYGNPTKDMKVVAITGATGKTVVAHYVHEILKASGEQVAVLASDQPFKMGTLHKFLSDAWKAGANVVIVTVPAEILRDNVFYGLPVHVAAMTNFVASSLGDMTADEFLESERTLFDMKPEIVVLNHDDVNYEKFEEFHGTQQTLSYGQTGRDVKVLNSKLYPKGTEATLSLRTEILPVATFVPGETAVAYMACAATIANAMGVSPEKIADGIAEYEPDN